MLFVYRSNRLERLADALAEVLKSPPPSPISKEWIGVQTQGVGTWLGMALSKRFGVWANGYHPFPRAVIDALFSSTLEKDDKERFCKNTGALTWGIMAILPNFLGRSEFSPLRHYLAEDPRGVKRYQLACRIARAFDQYAVYRSDMVTAWEAGSEETLLSLAPENRWQPVLWRALWKQLGSIHVVNVFKRYLSAMAAGKARLAELPARISFFGISTLPPLYVQVLEALPEALPVHLFLLSPSQEFWADIRSRKEIDHISLNKFVPGNSSEEELYLEEGHPLLATLGRLGREFQAILEENTSYIEPRTDLYEDPVPSGAGNMLSVLQSDMLNLRFYKKGNASLPPISPHDRSIEIHVCHSPMREVQVLHDQILGILDDDASLHPHDIIVMAPNIEIYAPFIEAVFGAGSVATHHIPYSISDRSLRQDATVIRAVMQLIELARGRLTIQNVIDFLSLEVVRERFNLSEEEVIIGTRWLEDVGIRWGLDSSHRAGAGQPAYDENTWRFGLDRLLLGMAMPEDHSILFGSVLPYTKVEGKEGETLGKLSAFCGPLFDIWQQFQSPKTALGWEEAFLQALSRVVTCRPETESQHQMIRQAFQAFLTDSMRAGYEGKLHLDVLECWLSDWLKQRPSTSGFLSGGVTFCNLLPMRSIPFRIVYLMGMNDLDFPRRHPSMGFDLTAMSPRLGDRSIRQDDRYLFLEALLSARSRFLVSYVGRDIKDNSVKPPSVVVDELLDMLDDGFTLDVESENDKAAATDLRDHLTTRHPLHPFHRDYFSTENEKLFSFSSVNFAGAIAGTGMKSPPPSFISMPLSNVEEIDAVVRIQDLLQFYKMPARFFLRDRLGISLVEETAGLECREPLSPDALERYDVGEFILNETLAGKAPHELYDLLRASGKLPLGMAGRSFFEDMVEVVTPIANEITPRMTEDKLPPLAVDMELCGVRIVGTIGNLWPQTRLSATVGTLSVNRKLSFWIEHLLYSCLVETDVAGSSLLVGRGRDRADIIEFSPAPDRALIWLSELVSLYLKGQTEPLRFFPNTSHAFAKAWHRGAGPDQQAKAMRAAQKAWQGSEKGFPGDAADLSVQRVFENIDPLTAGLENKALSFERLSMQIFLPMMTAMEIADDGTKKGRQP
jgi:exodeoxyribonuclease V gamma subunit